MSSLEPRGVTITIPGKFLPPVIMLAIMWVVQILSVIIPGMTGMFGVQAWNPLSLWAVFTSPFVHAGWWHLLSNSVPFLILGLIVAADGARRFAAVTLLSAIAGGLGVFVVNSPGVVTVGASGLVFGYFGYLLLRGVFAQGWGKKLLYIMVALTVTGVYGFSMFTGLIPRGNGVSWQGHLFGLIGGCLAAWALTRPSSQVRKNDQLPGASSVSLPREGGKGSATGDPELDQLLRELDIE